MPRLQAHETVVVTELWPPQRKSSAPTLALDNASPLRPALGIPLELLTTTTSNCYLRKLQPPKDGKTSKDNGWSIRQGVKIPYVLKLLCLPPLLVDRFGPTTPIRQSISLASALAASFANYTVLIFVLPRRPRIWKTHEKRFRIR